MDLCATQEPVPPRDTFFSDPVYSQRDVYLAYKVLIKQIAERLVEEDLRKIRHFCDLPSTVNLADSLDILAQLEKKGQFSYANVDPLKDLLQNIDRCDLVNQFVDPFKSRYSSSVVVEEYLNRSTHSLPPGNRSRHSTQYEATANGREEKSWPYMTFTGYPHNGSLTPGYSSRPSSRPNLSCVAEDVFLPPPTDVPPLGLPQPRATSSAGCLRTPSDTVIQGYAHREYRQQQQCASGIDLSLSSSYCRTRSTYCSSTLGPMSPFQHVERHRPQDRKAPVGRQTTVLRRKEMVNYVRDHLYHKHITVRHRLVLNLGCKNNPQLGFKVWPCGLEDDKDESVTFQADVYFPTKCNAAVVRSIVKLTVTATDSQTGERINTRCAEFSLHNQGTTVYDLIQHGTLIRSKSVTIGLMVETEVLDFHPQPQSEAEVSIEEVHSPMAEYQQEDEETFVDINLHPGSRPIPETQ